MNDNLELAIKEGHLPASTSPPAAPTRPCHLQTHPGTCAVCPLHLLCCFATTQGLPAGWSICKHMQILVQRILQQLKGNLQDGAGCGVVV